MLFRDALLFPLSSRPRRGKQTSFARTPGNSRWFHLTLVRHKVSWIRVSRTHPLARWSRRPGNYENGVLSIANAKPSRSFSTAVRENCRCVNAGIYCLWERYNVSIAQTLWIDEIEINVQYLIRFLVSIDRFHGSWNSQSVNFRRDWRKPRIGERCFSNVSLDESPSERRPIPAGTVVMQFRDRSRTRSTRHAGVRAQTFRKSRGLLVD